MKKVLFIALAFVVAAVMLVGCYAPTASVSPSATTVAPTTAPTEAPTTAPSEAPKVSFGMVTDIGKIGDKSFNDSGWAGFTKAGTELSVKPALLESNAEADYVPNLTNMVSQADLAIGVGFMMEAGIKEVAGKNPDKKFGTIDCVVDLPNVMSNVFAENEGSFLVGIAAGMTTKSNVIGFVGGMDVPLIRKFQAGFVAGVKSVNPKAKVIESYTGNFGDVAAGKTSALALFKQKADVIFHASGACGIGVINAADEKGFWAIGVDSDQAGVSKNNKVLCSMLKRVDNACYGTIMAYAKGTFKGGTVTWDLKADGVGVGDGGNNLSAEIKAAIQKYTDAFKAGKFTIPATMDELKTFTPPTL